MVQAIDALHHPPLTASLKPHSPLEEMAAMVQAADAVILDMAKTAVRAGKESQYYMPALTLARSALTCWVHTWLPPGMEGVVSNPVPVERLLHPREDDCDTLKRALTSARVLVQTRQWSDEGAPDEGGEAELEQYDGEMWQLD